MGRSTGIIPTSMAGFGQDQAGKLCGLPGYSPALPHSTLSLVPLARPQWPSGSFWIMSTSFLPLYLYISYLISLGKKTQNTIPTHNDVTPSFTSFRSLLSIISLCILSKNALLPPPLSCLLSNPQALSESFSCLIFFQSIYCYLTLFISLLVYILSVPPEYKCQMKAWILSVLCVIVSLVLRTLSST